MILTEKTFISFDY